MVSEQDEVYEQALCTNTENVSDHKKKRRKNINMTILAVTEDGSLCLWDAFPQQDM